jgi:hypothetical protein
LHTKLVVSFDFTISLPVVMKLSHFSAKYSDAAFGLVG